MEKLFVVKDEAGSRPKFMLLLGTPETATGVHRDTALTIKALLAKVPGKEVHRTFLSRTDGKEGTKIIQSGA